MSRTIIGFLIGMALGGSCMLLIMCMMLIPAPSPKDRPIDLKDFTGYAVSYQLHFMDGKDLPGGYFRVDQVEKGVWTTRATYPVENGINYRSKLISDPMNMILLAPAPGVVGRYWGVLDTK